MKMITLDDVYRSLKEDVFEITIPEDIQGGARLALNRMLAVPRD